MVRKFPLVFSLSSFSVIYRCAKAFFQLNLSFRSISSTSFSLRREDLLSSAHPSWPLPPVPVPQGRAEAARCTGTLRFLAPLQRRGAAEPVGFSFLRALCKAAPFLRDTASGAPGLDENFPSYLRIKEVSSPWLARRSWKARLAVPNNR